MNGVNKLLLINNKGETSMTKRDKISNKKELSPEQRKELLSTLKARFEKNMNRHNGIEWVIVLAMLEANTENLWSLNEMERTGGEPDVVGYDETRGEYTGRSPDSVHQCSENS